MRFPEKLDVLTVHARLIAETGGVQGLRMKLYSNLLLLHQEIAMRTKLPIL
jgi:hypothetical protein